MSSGRLQVIKLAWEDSWEYPRCRLMEKNVFVFFVLGNLESQNQAWDLLLHVRLSATSDHNYTPIWLHDATLEVEPLNLVLIQGWFESPSHVLRTISGWYFGEVQDSALDCELGIDHESKDRLLLIINAHISCDVVTERQLRYGLPSVCLDIVNLVASIGSSSDQPDLCPLTQVQVIFPNDGSRSH